MITILGRNDRTAATVAFSCRQIKLLKAFVKLYLRGNFLKRSCEFSFYHSVKKVFLKFSLKLIYEHVARSEGLEVNQ